MTPDMPMPVDRPEMEPQDHHGQPGRNVMAAKPKDEGLASLSELRAWHREGCEFFATYKDSAEEAEKAVYGEQWSDSEIAYLKKQGRLDLVFNHIQKNVMAVDGYRAENKLELEYLPKEQSDTEEAAIYTQLAKHYFDACMGEYEMDRVKLQQYIGPIGWFYCGFERDDPSREPLKIEYIPWPQMRFDPKGSDLAGLTWRYASRERWFELAEAQARFPEHAERLAEWATHARERDDSYRHDQDFGGDAYSEENTSPVTYLSDRQEVRIVETWYRRKKQGLYVKTPTGWEVFDEHNVDHQLATIMGAKMKPGLVDCVYFATWCGGLILEEGKSDYQHPYFPFVAMWGLRDHMGRPQGAVHAQLDPQKSHNWAMSKLLWQAASNVWMLPDGAVDDEAAFKANAARPDAIIRYNIIEGGAKPERLPHGEAAQLAGELADRALKDLSEIGGSPEAFRGQSSNETSGRAIARRQEGALRQQGIWFREEQRAYYQMGLMWRSMIAQVVDDEVIIRVTQPNGQTAYAAVNVEDPLRRADLEEQGYQVYGSITRLNYDTKVVVSPLSATIREKQAAEQAMLNDLMSPDQLAYTSDIRVLATNIKDKEKIAERIVEQREMQKAAMGMPPGGAPPVGPDGQPLALEPTPDGGPPPDLSTAVDNPEALMPPPPPEQMPGGFPMDPMMADPALMAGEMAVDGGAYFG